MGKGILRFSEEVEIFNDWERSIIYIDIEASLNTKRYHSSWSKEEIEAHRTRYVPSKEGVIIHPKMEPSN